MNDLREREQTEEIVRRGVDPLHTIGQFIFLSGFLFILAGAVLLGTNMYDDIVSTDSDDRTILGGIFVALGLADVIAGRIFIRKNK